MDRSALVVIDDDPDFRDLIRMFAEPEGAEIFEACDCVEGFTVLRKVRDRVAVVLVDYWMPNMEPLPCIEAIRGIIRPLTRLILVTAAVDAKERAVQLGISEWLSKPFDFEQLRAILVDSGIARARP